MNTTHAGTGRLSLTKTQLETQAGAELLSLCQTSTADGSLADEEIASLRAWLDEHRATDLPAIRFLLPLVEIILSDGVVTDHERRELFLAVEKILPQDVREMSRSARRLHEGNARAAKQADAQAKRLEAEAERQRARDERLRNAPSESFDFMVAGAKYEGRPAVIERYVRVGDAVQLVRDAGNRFSRNAIRVNTPNGRNFGMVPEEDAVELAPLLDAGGRYTARVKKVLEGSTHPIPVVVVDVFDRASSLGTQVVGSPSTRQATRGMPRAVVWVIVLVVFVLLVRACAALATP